MDDKDFYSTCQETFNATPIDQHQFNPEEIFTCRIHDDLTFLFPSKNVSFDTTIDLNDNRPIPNVQLEYLKHLREYINALTKSTTWEETKKNFDDSLHDVYLQSVCTRYQTMLNQNNERRNEQERITNLFREKYQDDQLDDFSIFSNRNDDEDNHQEKLSFFAIQSLTSILLILIKSAEKHDSSLVQQILTLTNQLCGQLPVKSLVNATTNKLLFKSLKPLINYVQDLGTHKDLLIAQQAQMALLSFAMAKGSLKEILPLLFNFIFNTKDNYPSSNLCIQLNQALKKKVDPSDSTSSLSIQYLESIDSFPRDLSTNVSGQVLASIIFAHLDIYHDENVSPPDPLTFEFHPSTYQQLYTIIDKIKHDQISNSTIDFILSICLRLFRVHVKYLSLVRHEIDINIYMTEDQRKNAYEFLLHYARDERETMNHEASKALIDMIQLRSSTFQDLITLLYDFIENRTSTVLIEQCYTVLNEEKNLNQWIDLLINSQTESILKSFLDRYFQQTDTSLIEPILLRLQEYLFYRLFHCCGKKKLENINDEIQLSFNPEEAESKIMFYIKYLSFFLEKPTSTSFMDSTLISSLHLHLYLLTDTDRLIHYEPFQTIFITILPWLVNNFLSSSSTPVICLLIGQICQRLIIGLPSNEFELKQQTLFKSSIFAGGCECNLLEQNQRFKTLIESNLARSTESNFHPRNENSEADQQFLLSIYHQTDPGRKLFNKMKQAMKHKGLPILQKTIEPLANNSLTQIFAVFIKHFRRLNLAQDELIRVDSQSTIHPQLLSIFQSATRVFNLFAKVKGQGGDCEELARQIETKTHFLLFSVKESQSIPLIEIKPLTKASTTIIPPPNRFNRQRSHWSKAKHVLKLLQHLFHACIRFKRFMIEKKQAIQRIYDYETLNIRSMELFLYADLAKLTETHEQDNEKTIDLEQLKLALLRQNERAMTRLLTYRFIKEFLIKKDNQSHWKILLPFARKKELEWSYLEHIPASNEQIKQEISRTYYSIIDSVLNEDPSLVSQVFSLLNLSYDAIDFSSLAEYQFLPKLFQSFLQLPHSSASIREPVIAFQWLRLFTFQLCQEIELDQIHQTTHLILQEQKQNLFQTFILKELQKSEQMQIDLPATEALNSSLIDMTMQWFYQVAETKEIKNETRFDLALYINQYLILLLRCIHIYPHVIQQCRSIDYLKVFIDIYHHYPHSYSTQILTLKILRALIPSFNDVSNNLIEGFLNETLRKIGEKNPVLIDVQSELIHLYRTIMSVVSPWQNMATDLILQTIQSSLTLSTIEKNDPNEIDTLLAALMILGGHIEPYRRGSLVQILTDEEVSTDESQSALIIDINQDQSENGKPYTIQNLLGQETAKFSLDKIQLKIDVEPPRIKDFHSILESLSQFIQIDSSKSNSLILIQCQRRVLAILNHLLGDKECAETFMKKSYGPILARLAMQDKKPEKLREFDRDHLEHYALSLDEQEGTVANSSNEKDAEEDHKTITKDEKDITSALSTSNYHGWKPMMSEEEIQEFRRGYYGKETLILTSLPKGISKPHVFQMCGEKHRFLGHIAPDYENTNSSFPSYILDQVQLSEGKWYYCVRLPVGGLVQIGWATKGYTPHGSCGVGDDAFSWSYDGSRAVFFNNGSYYGAFDGINWDSNDICGCGIEINGNQTNIKYWLNGKFLGTAFAHEKNQYCSDTKCDLLPHGPETTFFPSVSLQRNNDPIRTCELIFSPEDMNKCPLPYGYKPLLFPKAVRIENSLVDYPFSAYLIGDHSEDHWLTKGTTRLLRDFVHDHHLEASLPLTEQSTGLPMIFQTETNSSMTISFDFKLTNSIEEKLDIILCTLDLPKSFFIPLTFDHLQDQRQHIVMTFKWKDSMMEIFVNQPDSSTKAQLCDISNIKTFTLHLLPKLTVDIKNLAIWHYALSDDDLHRLLKQGIFYVAADQQKIKEFNKHKGKIEFSTDQTGLSDGRLVLFNEPFDENAWEKKKKQIDIDADDNVKKYFQRNSETNHSILQLYGSKSYIVLEKSTNLWFEYTFILDLLVPQLPSANQSFTLIHVEKGFTVTLSNTGELICQIEGDKHKSKSSIPVNEFFRLSMIVQDRQIQIMVNKTLSIDWTIDQHSFHLSGNNVRFFNEQEPEKTDITDDVIRWSLKSLIYADQYLPLSGDVALDTLIQPPVLLIGSSLIAMGYKKSWIESLVKDEHLTDIPMIHAALRQRKEKFIQLDIEKTRHRYQKIFSKVDSPDQENYYHQLFETSTLQTKDEISTIFQHLVKHWLDQSPERSPDKTSSIVPKDDKEWFSKTVKELGLDVSLNIWLLNKSQNENDDEINDDDDDDDDTKKYDLLDLAHPERFEENLFTTSIKRTRSSVKYSQSNLTQKQFLNRRLACEQGLIIIYARITILNLFQNWSDEKMKRIPLGSLADYSVLVQLLTVLNETHIDIEGKTNPVQSILYEILLDEIQPLATKTWTHHQQILEKETALLFHLQKYLITHVIEYHFIQEKKAGYFEFTFQVYELFLKLLSHPHFQNQHQRNLLLFLLFPRTLIHYLFNIFLLVPSQKEKIFLLHLFTRLIQLSDQDILTVEQEQFFVRFTNELSSEKLNASKRTKKRLQNVLNDLIFALRSKERADFEILLKTLPEKTQDLFMLIDVIDVTLNDNKQSVLPDEFFNFVKKEVTKEEFFTAEHFQKANRIFTRAADLELIRFIDEKCSSLISETDKRDSFFADLPKETEINATFYKEYSLLSSLPADCIDARARYLFLFNLLASYTFEGVGLNCSPDESFLMKKLLSVKIYFLHSMKWHVFNESLEETQIEYDGSWLAVNFDTVKASTNEKSENTMFYQAYQQLYPVANRVFRQNTEQLWRAQYIEMHSTDQGGPYRDSITRIVADICSTRLSLFILCPNGRTGSGSNRDCWIPNVFPPDKPIPKKFKKQYRFVGQLLGMAIRKKHYFDLKLAPLFWKSLLNEEITVKDIESIDEQSFTMIYDLEKNVEQIRSMEGSNDLAYVFASILGEVRFEVVSSAGPTFELIPGGSDIPITLTNFTEYCSSYRQYRLEEFQRQMKYIRQGLYNIIPPYYLSLFTAKELEEAVCGKGRIDIDLLKRNTYYGSDFTDSHPLMQRFWNVFRDKFTDEQRRLFLIFVWGRSTLPTRDEDFSSKFSITRYDVYDEDTVVDRVLPRSHTCFFTIDLPEYSTEEIMCERLIYAITSCSSIDGDGMMNEAPGDQDDSDDESESVEESDSDDEE